MKMTFKKKDPELVTLYFVAPDLPTGKACQYRVSKRQEFVSALQVGDCAVVLYCSAGTVAVYCLISSY